MYRTNNKTNKKNVIRKGNNKRLTQNHILPARFISKRTLKLNVQKSAWENNQT